MTAREPRLSAAERGKIKTLIQGFCKRENVRIRKFRIAGLLADLADREADATRLADEIAELRDERDRLAAALADREKDVGRAWIAGRDASAICAEEHYLARHWMSSINEAPSKIAAAIRALTPSAGSPLSPDAKEDRHG